MKSKNAGKQPNPKKRPHTAPKLTVYGDTWALTSGNTGTKNDGSGGGEGAGSGGGL